jgi:mono/diheme cytochrome c family protein
MKSRAGKIKIASSLCLAIALIVSCKQSRGKAQAGSPSSPDEQPFQQLIRSVEGPDLFRAYCASCHGTDAKGHGPAAASLKAKVPDLTVLQMNNGGTFPVRLVRGTITGENLLASHGSREMPIWGPIFHQIETDVDRGNVRVENLVKYLESIQSTRSSQVDSRAKVAVAAMTEEVPSGAQLYNEHCSACHGNDLKGDGPAPYPFRAPPDLTTLARRHGDRFPDAYVSDVLRNGVKMPAHGPAEMPIWGADFRAAGQLSENQVALRIVNLSNYIKSLQIK